MKTQENHKGKIQRYGELAYTIKNNMVFSSKTIKRRGLIIEEGGTLTTVPDKEGTKRARPIEIRSVENGKLTLSPKKHCVTMTISLDRDKDSPEAFTVVFDKLIDGYTIDVLKKEMECLGLDM